jgi:hypothetical protein
MKTSFQFVILESLLNSVKAFAERGRKSVSEVFEVDAKRLIQSPKSLPMRPSRRVTRYGKGEKYKLEFPTVRTSIWMDPSLFLNLQESLKRIAKSQFDEDLEIDLNTIIHTVLYYFCKENLIDFDEKFFDDTYFNMVYTYADGEKELLALRKLAEILKKSPTAREWNENRYRVDGASMVALKDMFGSFNEAKKLAGLYVRD